MKKIAEKPHFFFFGLIPVSIILGFIFKNNSLKIAYYGGDFSINYWNTFLIMAVFFSLMGLNYFALNWAKKRSKKWLTIIHILFQTLSLILFVIYILKIDNVKTENEADIINIILFCSLLLFVISVFIHLINFIISLISKED
ncbi:hypothetical protein LPB136_02060 [Tenacibaculum todarodis]|uniref:Uncharacterized protein n=1 Tax=Tenacibaculum todarodis TaxID=1850252 RepID=A0A1L3JGH2_9FLAO|nr:hypothetical protein [Tenacibaculum todarodis]APG64224.1 hypothetical protein LPB136_02060 [Tenacibaculum todarodis]